MMWVKEFTEPFTLTSGGKAVLSAEFAADGVHVTCYTHTDREFAVWLEGQKDFTFRLFSSQKGSMRLERRNASLRLYCNGALTDEDWLVGNIPPFDSDEGIVPVDSFPADAGFDLTNYNANIGDCMPFNYKGEYRLFALFDRRHHGSKAGLGAHQWMQRSTADLVHWQDHSIAVGIDEEWEGSICTGSLIEHEGKVYAFYAVRMTDGSPAKLTYAVSDDCEHFKKSGKYLSLTDPYEPTSARDPTVFRDENGLFHMLVTSSYLPLKHRNGCLAHLTSRNLTDWEQQEPFLLPGYDGQPECSDYFKMGDLYYIVYSGSLVAQYLVSEKPFGPWRKLREDVLDPCLCVPKTAEFGNKRLVSGWIPTGHWGGFVVTRELIQRSDGTLGTRMLDKDVADAVMITESETELNNGCIRIPLKPETPDMSFAVTVSCGNAVCGVEFDSGRRIATLFACGQNDRSAPAGHRVSAPWCADAFEIKLILNKDSVEFALPDDVCLVTRRPGEGVCTVSVFGRNGSLIGFDA